MSKISFSQLFFKIYGLNKKILIPKNLSKKNIFKAIDSNARFEWSQELFSNPKCLNYRCFKVSLQLESYTSDDRLTTVQKIALC